MGSHGTGVTPHFAHTNMKTKAVVALTMLIAGAAVASAGSCDWKAPPTAANRPNPVPSNPNTIALGQKLYTANCFTCHGESGKGDGPGGAALEKKPADLGGCIKSNNETDGSLFWKISEGRSDGSSFTTSKRLPENNESNDSAGLGRSRLARSIQT